MATSSGMAITPQDTSRTHVRDTKETTMLDVETTSEVAGLAGEQGTVDEASRGIMGS